MMSGGGSWIGICALFLSACSAASESDMQVTEVSPAGEQADALSRSALSSAQSKSALKLIDDICGDTWCSGDYNFGFRRLTCAEQPHRADVLRF